MSPRTVNGVLTEANQNEIIVALEHTDLVQGLIGESTRMTTVSSPTLRLSKLVLDNVSDAVKQLTDLVDAEPATADYRERIKINPKSYPLDVLLQSLRQLSAARYGGWLPTIGKNRIVARPRELNISAETGWGTGGEQNISAETGWGTGGELNMSAETGWGSSGEVNMSAETGWGGVGEPRAALEDKRWQPPPARAGGPGEGARVGVLDTAVYPQAWLAGGWVARYSDTVPEAEDHLFSAGHATFLTGLILGQAPGATVEVRQVLDDEGTGDAWSVAEAIVDIGRSGLDVLNLSFSCYTADGDPPLVLAAAIDRLDPDLVVVAAAGNHAEIEEDASPVAKKLARLPAWPAALDDVVAVGADESYGKRAAFSPDAPWVDLYAPGVDVPSAYLDRASAPKTAPKRFAETRFNGWARWSGTSFSAALVSGLIAAGVDPGRVSGQDALNDIVGQGTRHLKMRLW